MITKQLGLIMLLFAQSLFAKEQITGVVSSSTNEKLAGAILRWQNSTRAVSADENGFFAIDKQINDSSLIASYVGYKTDTIRITQPNESLKIRLMGVKALKEVVVTDRGLSTINSRITPLQTQTIGLKELQRAACCNLSESFETNASVDVNYSDAATGAKQIRLLGLSGSYVQMLNENVPTLRGAAALYGLDYIPGPWMESIQISKGASSVRNGYESVTGQINVEYKKPQNAGPVTVNLFGNDAGRFEANVDATRMFDRKLGSTLFLHYSNDKQVHDNNGDGFLDQPKLEQINVMNRWYYKENRFISQTVAHVISDNRKSGESMSMSANPYNIDIKTNRAEFFTKNGYIIDKEHDASIALILSASHHDQKSQFGIKQYDMAQTNMYANLLYDAEWSHTHHLSTGVTLNIDKLDEYRRVKIDNRANTFQRNESTVSAFGEYTFNLHHKFILLAGIRADHHNEYGTFVTPRVNLKYTPAKFLTLRASVGKGYRSVNPLAENSYLLASSRKLDLGSNLKMESATNYGASMSWNIPIAGKELSVIAEYFRTDFQNQVVVDLDADSHAVSFYNLNGKSFANNYQIEASYSFVKGLLFTAAYRSIDTKTTYGDKLLSKPLTGSYKGMFTTSYQTPIYKWQFDATLQLNGGGRMPTPDAINPLWNEKYPDYKIVNLQVTKGFKNWSIYSGVEDLFDFRQNTPIVAAHHPYGNDFDATMIWGPIHGRKIYFGLRWGIPKI